MIHPFAGRLWTCALVGAAVFAATIVYLIDRIGWPLGLILGWAPALLMGLAAVVCQVSMALIVEAHCRRTGPVGDSELKVPSARVRFAAH